jgi:hypothetical protein
MRTQKIHTVLLMKKQGQAEVQLHLLLSSQSKLSPTRVQHLKSVDERRKSYPNQSQGIINIDFIIEMTED